VFRPIDSLSRFLSHLRWLYMPVGLFALVAVGVHAGASVTHDGVLVGLDWLDGVSDRAMTVLLTAVGALFHAEPATIDRWVFNAVSLVDMHEREVAASWLAVVLELTTDLVLALPALGYRERRTEEVAREASKQARLAELVAQKLEAKRPGAHPTPVGNSLVALLRSAILDPTLLRWLLPVATAAAALAGACRIATEMQAMTFGAVARLTDSTLAGNAGRAVAVFVLLGVLLSLGVRSVVQSLWWAHRRAESDRAAGLRSWRRRAQGWMRLAVAGPLAAAAVLYGPPVLSFFR
jgi:hypothetical protein